MQVAARACRAHHKPPIGGPPLLPSQRHQVLCKHRGHCVFVLHAAAGVLVGKGSVKDVQGAVVPVGMVGVSCIVVVVAKAQAHWVPIVVAAHLLQSRVCVWVEEVE